MAKSISTQGRKGAVVARLSEYQLNKNVSNRVWMERIRQQSLLKFGKHRFTCATSGIDPDKKLRVAGEEYGEIARAIDLLESAAQGRAFGGDVRKAKEHLREEVTHLTAVGFAWLEALEEELK